MARTLAIVFFVTSLLLAAALGGTWWYTYRLLKSINPPPPEPLPQLLPAAPVSPLQVRYQLDLPGRGEIFPALAAGNPSDYWPVAVLSIANASDRPLLQSVSSEIPGWSRRSARALVIGPHETRTIRINPELLPQSYENSEMRRAVLEVSAGNLENPAAYSQARPVYLHAVSDLYWGTKFANAQFIARWVTPHDPAVIKLVSSARKYVTHGRLAGYHLPGNSAEGVEAQVRTQARAVFDAMRRIGISYVDSIFTFGNFSSDAQRIRLPRETLLLSGANCIDVSVAFASAVENLGMDPVIVIVPGHAFTGIRLAPDSQETLYLDLTVLPNGTFERAKERAQYWMKKSPPDQVLVIDIAAARALGIYPIPDPLAQRS
ncbi:MAG TPA: hypothetical protein VFJ47_02895 [Terriglobales bacterium]|nr:hypothetical protein [Terriglobales bacterium]